jgi:hypothetical protein
MRSDTGVSKNADLEGRFCECETLGDANAWDELGMRYYNRGFLLNAGVCFKKADDLRAGDKPTDDNSSNNGGSPRRQLDQNGEFVAASKMDGGLTDAVFGCVVKGESGYVATIGDGWCVGAGRTADEAIDAVISEYERIGNKVSEVEYVPA